MMNTKKGPDNRALFSGSSDFPVGIPGVFKEYYAELSNL